MRNSAASGSKVTTKKETNMLLGAGFLTITLPEVGTAHCNYNNSQRPDEEYRGNRRSEGPTSYGRYRSIPPVAPDISCMRTSQSRQEPEYVPPTKARRKEMPIPSEEQRAHDFVDEVLRQEGVRGQLIFYMSENDTPATVLQSAANYMNIKVQLITTTEKDFQLMIGTEEFGKGQYASKHLAKQELSKLALVELQKFCFSIVKKNAFEDVSINDESKQVERSRSSLEGSKAYKMLLNMGWSGKGLGANEQGDEKTVAEQISENISRGGLGSGDIFAKIKRILEEFAMSDKLTALRFEPDFTSEDRDKIHKFAQRLGLKTKSTGKEPKRRLAVMKKLDRRMLVIQLLSKRCDSESYRLMIPRRFAFRWSNLDEEDDDCDQE